MCWAARRTVEPCVAFNNSGQSGTLSRFAEMRKIAAASAINFEYWKTKFTIPPYLSVVYAQAVRCWSCSDLM